MQSEITTSLVCIVIRGGMEIWMPGDKLTSFDTQYSQARKNGGLLFFEGERINPADVVGVFKAQTMEATTRRKNGQWLCQQGTWHDRQEKCLCTSRDEKARNEAITAAIKACGKCNNGWENGTAGVRRCRCVAHFFQ